MIEFKAYPKTPRLDAVLDKITVTEKIDGTNAQITIADGQVVMVGSRNREIKVGDDNFGFAAWVDANKNELVKLGEGTHYGEWFGEGIQKNPLGVTCKRFALFNTFRDPSTLPDCVENVPILYEGNFEAFQIAKIISDLEVFGSSVKGAAMGAKPEGFIVYFHGFRKRVKWTFEHQKGKWNTQ